MAIVAGHSGRKPESFLPTGTEHSGINKEYCRNRLVRATWPSGNYLLYYQQLSVGFPEIGSIGVDLVCRSNTVRSGI